MERSVWLVHFILGAAEERSAVQIFSVHDAISAISHATRLVTSVSFGDFWSMIDLVFLECSWWHPLQSSLLTLRQTSPVGYLLPCSRQDSTCTRTCTRIINIRCTYNSTIHPEPSQTHKYTVGGHVLVQSKGPVEPLLRTHGFINLPWKIQNLQNS